MMAASLQRTKLIGSGDSDSCGSGGGFSVCESVFSNETKDENLRDTKKMLFFLFIPLIFYQYLAIILNFWYEIANCADLENGELQRQIRVVGNFISKVQNSAEKKSKRKILKNLFFSTFHMSHWAILYIVLFQNFIVI